MGFNPSTLPSTPKLPLPSEPKEAHLQRKLLLSQEAQPPSLTVVWVLPSF